MPESSFKDFLIVFFFFWFCWLTFTINDINKRVNDLHKKIYNEGNGTDE